ncbi:hypothetical protein MtrunA17_Chr4g0003261 [Medicago truncatula]|uniref:Uncharacterized protein n=1 Tax=Medicago truncatula TaxID=3880 RepID=G7JGY1_MEDTR|nr:hypothetical protein MTR_4g010170 [Medicago truncatula]RHN58516.1 hypothetical protein MtrunA17_Chr4g0003261 [Medicago truncatula]
MRTQSLASPGVYGNCVKTLSACHWFECWQMDGGGDGGGKEVIVDDDDDDDCSHI